MRVLFAAGDEQTMEALRPAFGHDRAEVGDLAVLTEPAAFQWVHDVRPDAVVIVPDWTRTDNEELRGCWWLARAADLARTPLLLLSTAAVFAHEDRTPRTEFDTPAPTEPVGRYARAAELLVERTAHASVIVRTGPLDVGMASLPRLLASAGGVAGGAGQLISPVSSNDIAPLLRELAVGRRFGTWHLAGEALSLAECASRLGLPAPDVGGAPVPTPLRGHMMALSGGAPLDAWPRVA